MENKVDVGKKVDAGKPVDTPENNATVHPVAFLLPTYKTPLLTSNLLHTAHSCGCYADACSFSCWTAETLHCWFTKRL